jgi:hypothetical protein
MPYPTVKPIDVIKRVKDGMRPQRPAGVSDEFWSVAASCWIEVLQTLIILLLSLSSFCNVFTNMRYLVETTFVPRQLPFV